MKKIILVFFITFFINSASAKIEKTTFGIDMDIPNDYFELDNVNKEVVCLVLMERLLTLIDRQFDERFNRIEILNKLIDSSIESNINDEIYEIAAVLRDIKKVLNE
jgi:hypothetical protein